MSEWHALERRRIIKDEKAKVKMGEPVAVMNGGMVNAEFAVKNFANKGKYGAEYNYLDKQKAADPEGLMLAYAERIRQENAERQKGWDAINDHKAAMQKKKSEDHAKFISMQVAGFMRHTGTQAQRIAAMRLEKQRKTPLDLDRQRQIPAASEVQRGAGRRPQTAPPHRGSSAERRCAEIAGRRACWRNGRGMAFPVERWFEDEFADFGPIVRAEEVKHVMEGFRRNRDAHAPPLPSPCKMGVGRPLGARKAWPQGHSAWPINNEAQEAVAAAAAASRAAGTDVEEEEELRRKRRQFAGGRGERVGRQEAQRGPAVFPVGKNKRGCVWGAAPDLLRMLGNQEARNMNPNGELGRRYSVYLLYSYKSTNTDT
jgi:hypothetical protein